MRNIQKSVRTSWIFNMIYSWIEVYLVFFTVLFLFVSFYLFRRGAVNHIDRVLEAAKIAFLISAGVFCIHLFIETVAFGPPLRNLLESESAAGVVSARDPSIISNSIAARGDLTSLALGVIGLVITGMTGMALAVGWNSLSESRRLHESVRYEMSSVKNHISEMLRLAAYTEALELRIRYPYELARADNAVADILCSAFSSSPKSDNETDHPARSLAAINSDVDAQNAFLLLVSATPNIRLYLRRLSEDPSMSSGDRQVLFKLLGEIG